MTKAEYKKHKKVIEWFYMQEDTVCVLVRDKERKEWIETNYPTFTEDNEYLINDEYIDFRNAIYMGRTLELKEAQTNEWIPVLINDPNEKFVYHSDMYRVEEDTYPVYKKNDFMVVKFINKEECEVLFIFDGEKASEFAAVGKLINDENVNDKQWKNVAYNERRDLWDGQPVWCIGKHIKVSRTVTFYDVLNVCTFEYGGERDGSMCDDYLPYEHLTDKWIIEAYNKLEF